MKHVIAYLKETREAYARMISMDETTLDVYKDAKIRPYAPQGMKDRLAYRKEFLDELDDAIEILEDK